MNYLLQPIIQIEDSDGNPLVGGKVYVYDHSTQNLAVTYSDFQSHMNTNPIILDSLGHCVIIAEADKLYDVIVKNAADELQFSIINASVIGGTGDITIINPEVSVVAGTGISVTKTPMLDGSYRYTVALSNDLLNHLSQIDGDITDIKNDITEINNELTEIETNVTNITNDVNIIEADVETLKNVSYQMPLRKDGNVVSNNGSDLTVTGDCAWAEGKRTTANGMYSHAEGWETVAGELCTHAEGQHAKASGMYSHAEGVSTESSGHVSHAEGNNTTASGAYAHAEGIGTTAEGSASHAEGSNTKASGEYTHAEGLRTEATGARSHAGGFSTQATGTESFAHGNSAISNGRASSALGFGVVTNETGALAIGKYNVDERGHVFQVGIGSLPSERKDAFQIDTDGTIRYIYNDVMVQLKPVTSRNVYVVATVNTHKTADDQPSDYWYDDYYLPIQPGETFNGCIFFTAPTTAETSNSGKYVSFVGHITDEQHNYYNDIHVPECSVRTTYHSALSVAEWTAKGCVPISFTNDSDKNLRISCGFSGNLLKNSYVNVFITGTITA